MINPNVILIILDSLCFKSLGFSGRSDVTSISPFLDKLSQKGLSLHNCFTSGAPTSFAYPGIMTSTYPLDLGGFDYGMRNRKSHLAEDFKLNGYKTYMFFETWFGAGRKYDAGFDEIFYMYDLYQFTAGGIRDRFGHFINYKDQNFLEGEDFLIFLEKDYLRTLNEVEEYLEKTNNDIEKGEIIKSTLITPYNYVDIIGEIREYKKEFLADPQKFINDILKGDQGFFKILSKYRDKVKALDDSCTLHKNYKKLLRPYYRSLLKSGWRSPKRLRQQIRNTLPYYRNPQQNSKNYATAEYLKQNLVKQLKGHDHKEPLFAVIHTVDIHERNFFSHDILNNDKVLEEELELAQEFIKKDASNSMYKGNLLYDLSVKYTDKKIQDLFEELDAINIDETNTVFAIVADHGLTESKSPQRKGSHIARDFYDELYHIPAIFYGKGVPNINEFGLSSNVDIPSTLLSLSNCEVPYHYRGLKVNEPGFKRDHVIMDHTGPGPCVMSCKNKFICIRDHKFKIIYKVNVGFRMDAGEYIALYDLEKDPEELRNLIETVKVPKYLNEICLKRANEIAYDMMKS